MAAKAHSCHGVDVVGTNDKIEEERLPPPNPPVVVTVLPLFAFRKQVNAHYLGWMRVGLVAESACI